MSELSSSRHLTVIPTKKRSKDEPETSNISLSVVSAPSPSLAPTPALQAPSPYPNMTGLNQIVNTNLICIHCGLSLPRHQFTQQQLNKKKLDEDSPIFCKSCAPKQQLVLECSECDEVKSASKFARNQLSKAEGARCLSCQNRINKRNSKRRKTDGYSDDDEDEEEEEEDDSD